MFKIGDLVMVVKPTTCCCNPKALGRIFTITEAKVCRAVKCVHCHEWVELEAMHYSPTTKGMWYAGSRLKKIEPLSKLEDKLEEWELTK